MSDNPNVDPEDDDDSPEGRRRNRRNTLLGFLATIVLMAVIFGVWRGCDHLRIMGSSPDRVHAVYTGTLRGRPVVYILNSMLMNEDDHEDRLNDSAYRLDVYDLASGERISRTSTGIKSSWWIEASDSIAWLRSRDTNMGLYACNVLTGKVIVEEKELVNNHPQNLKPPLDISLQRSHDSDGVAAFPSAHLTDGAELRISKSTGRVERASAGSPVSPASTFIRGGFLYDIGSRKPLEPGAAGSCVVLHYESEDDDAGFLLTALGSDGGVLWKATSEGLDSDTAVRAALRVGKDLILITDEEMIYLDAAKGTVGRRVEM
jgi:hypothetical protein